MKSTPFWVDDFPRPHGLDTALPGETDYLIVGSGLTGLSCALRLADSGKRVTILDSGEIASGASSMNGGMVSPDVKAGMKAIEARHGPSVADEMWASTVESVTLIDDIDSRYGLDAVVARGGMTGLGLRADDLSRFRDQVDWYNERFDTGWQAVDREGIGALVGESRAFTAAFYEPEGLGVHPARLAFGLARVARDAGVDLVPQAGAEVIESDRSGFAIRTAQGRVKAGNVILATNGYTTTRPLPALRKKLVPVGSYVIVTEPLPEATAKAIFPTNSMAYTPRRLLNYMRRTHDNRILIGGRRNLRTGLDLEESAADLRRRLIQFWPHLEETEISHVWGGQLAVPFDLTPHIGRIGGVWYALGYAGHGVALSTQLGHELGGMLLGESAPSVYSRIPHRGRFYYRGRPWFLGPASILFRTLDRFGR